MAVLESSPPRSCCPPVRVLLDESLPRSLLRLAADSFDVLLTADRNLEHQQNLTTLPLSVVVLVAPTNRLESLAPLVPELLELLNALPSRRLVHIGA